MILLRRHLGWIAALLAVLSLIPIWAGRLLPLLDAPTHLGAASIWQHLPDPTYGLSAYYVKNTPLTPYGLHYAFLHYVGYAVGLEVANKLFVSLYLLGFPAGVWLLLRATRRDPVLVLFAFPLAWNLNLLMGFFSNLLGILVFLPTLALLVLVLDRPSLGRGALLVVAGMALYLAHPLPWVALGACGLSVCASRGLAGLKRGALAYALLAPSLLLAVIQTWYYRPAGVGAVTGGGFEGRFKPLGAALGELPNHVMSWWPGHWDEAIAACLCASALALLVTDRGSDDAARFDLLPCALICLGLYFALPVEMFRPAYWWLIGARLVPFALLFLGLAPRHRIRGPRLVALAPVLAAGIFLPCMMTARTVRFNRRAAPLARIAAQIPKGTPALTLVMSPREDPDFTQPLYRAFHSYVLLWRGGVSPYEFPIGFPFRYLRVPPAPPWYAPEQYSFEQHGRHWPFVLTWHDELGRVARNSAMQLVASDEGFRLYRNTDYTSGP